MRRIFRLHKTFFSSLTASALSLAVVTGATMVVLSPSAYAKSSSGNVAVSTASDSANKAVKVVNGQVVIDAPPASVWEALTQYSEMKNYIPGYKKSDVVSANGINKVLDLALSVSQLLPVYRYKVQVSENKKQYTLNVKRLSGDFKQLTATYHLVPRSQGSQTLLVHKLAIDPGVRMLGTNTILDKHAFNTLSAIQKRAEEIQSRNIVGKR